MSKKFYTFWIIGLLLILLIREGDVNSSIVINWRGASSVLPLAGALLWLWIFVAVIYGLNFLLHKMITGQLNEALRFSGNETRNAKSGKLSDKVVLNRADIDNSMMLLLKAMTSVTAGDMTAARKCLKELRNLIGDDTIVDVLTLKIYKGEKNFDKMEELSSKLMNNPDLELVSLKAAVEAQMQKKEFEQALITANKAFEVRQDLYWVIESAFNLRAKAGDWEGALQVLNSGFKKKIVPAEKYKHLKAVTLYQLAENAKQSGDSVNFFKYCSQALECDPQLVPAALALAEYYVQNDNQTRKAANVLSNIWRRNPTTEIAEMYLNLWPDDTAAARVQRMESLALTNSKRPSLNNLLLAVFDAKAKFWNKARSEFEIFLINNPATKRIAKVIYEYEKHFHKNEAAAQSWKNKTASCADDSVWVCPACGNVSKKWQPVCDKCSAVGEYKWHLYVEKSAKDD
jgi:HemY protein